MSKRRKQEPPPVVFFVDRSLGSAIVPQALRDAGALVEIHDDHFAKDAEDVEWLTEAGAQGWAVLTKDRRIRYRPAERDLLLTAGVAAFFLSGGRRTGEEIAEVYVKALPRMTKAVRAYALPFVARVQANGRVVMPDDAQRRGGSRKKR